MYEAQLLEAGARSRVKPRFDMDGRLPIVVAVTGHRDLLPRSEEELKPRVRSFLKDRLLDRFLETPVLIMGGLAEGADRLVARVVMDLKKEGYAKRLAFAAILPMPISALTSDFESSTALQELEELLDQADIIHEMPVDPGASIEDLRSDGGLRKTAYTRQAALLVRNAHVLLALYDGVELPAHVEATFRAVARYDVDREAVDQVVLVSVQTNDGIKEGGTRQVVDWFCRGVPNDLDAQSSRMDEPDGIWLEHVVAARRSTDGAKGPRRLLDALATEPDESWKEASSALCKLDRLNSWIVCHCSTDNAKCVEPLPNDLREKYEREVGVWVNAFKTFDAGAERSRRYVRISFWALLAVAATVVLLQFLMEFLLGKEQIVPAAWFRAGQWALLLIAVAGVFHIRKRAYEEANRTLRVIAEALRVQIFWSLTGIEESVDRHYGRIHRGTVSVVRHALRGIGVLARLQRDPGQPMESERLLHAKRHWIEDQRQWLQGRIHWCLRWTRLADRGFSACVAMGLLLGAASMICASRQSFHLAAKLFVVMGTVLAIGIFVRELNKFWAFEAEHNQYEALASILDECSRELDKIAWTGDRDSDLNAARQSLKDAGVDTLAENLSWFNVRLHRQLELNPK